VITIDRTQPTFVAKAIGVLTGRITPSPDGSTGTLTTRDGVDIPITILDRAIAELMADPTVFASEVDCLVWPRTRGMDLEALVIKIEPAVKHNPDRDLFLIQGISLRSRRFGNTSKIGIRVNTSDRNNQSNFDRFWLSLHGYLTDGLVNTVYQVKARRKGRRLFIMESAPHIKTGKRWVLQTKEQISKK